MTGAHTIKAFDNELEQLRTAVIALGATVQRQLDEMLEVLGGGDRMRAAKVIELDATADDQERQVHAEVVRILAAYQPVANDLRAVIGAERAAGNLERVGDHAKSIAKRIIRFGDDAWRTDAVAVQRFGRQVGDLLATAIGAYGNDDLAAATEAWTGDAEIDETYDDLFHALLVAMQEGRTTIAVGTQLLFVAKSLERIGDHATNVAEEVRFILTGRAEDRHSQGA